MNVLYSPRMTENTVRGWLECVFRPCYRPPSWPMNMKLCPASWFRVTARLPSWPLFPYPLSLPMHISQASGMAYKYKQTCESL